jgi:hypothetical protein
MEERKDTIDPDQPDFDFWSFVRQYLAAGFDPLGPQGSSNPEYKTLAAYLRQIFGPLPEGAVDWQASDLNGDGVNELYAVDSDGNPHTIYGYDDDGETESTVYSDYLRDTIYGGKAPQTWEDVERILRAEGYSDSEIASAENSLAKTKEYSEWLEKPENKGKVFYGLKYCHELKEVNEYDDDCQTRGSINLGYILGEFGYEDAGWWDTRPTAGTGCTTSEGTAGITNPDGTCREDPTQLPGASCADGPHGSEGILDKDGNCTFVAGNSCDPPNNPDGYGTIDAAGNCIENADCTTVNQENAEECGYEITSDGQLIPKDLDDPNLPNYTPCGGNIFVQEGTECPDVGGVVDCNANPNDPECADKSFQDYVDEVGEDIANTAKGIYDDFKDVITDCVGNPIECIKKIGDKVAEAGIPAKCQDLEGCDTANPDKGTYCWKDCVNFNVLVGIPGLPQLPGMGEIDVGTYRDFEDFLKGIGKDIGDFIEDPAGTLEGWKDAVLKKVKEIFGDATDTKASDIIDWLKGIFGVYAATWVWGELEEEITNLLPIAPIDEDCPEDVSEINADNFEKCGYQDCGEGKYVKVGESCDDPDPFDETKCVEEDYFNDNKDACETAGYVNCTGGENSSGQETTGGIIQGIVDDCDVIQDPQCSDVGTYNPASGECDCPEGYEFDVETGGTCGEKDGDDGDDECPDPNQVRRGGIAGAACVTPGHSCFAEPSKYPGDSTTTNQGQYSTEGFCIDVSGGQCTNGNEPEYLPEDTDQDGAFFYGGDSITYDPCADDIPSSMYFTPAPELVCNDENADPPEGDDGGCGPCKSGFEFDKDKKKCVREGDDGGTDEPCEEGDELDTKQWDYYDDDKDGIVVDSEGQSYSYDPCNPSLGFTPIDDPNTNTGTPGEECTMEIPAFYAPSCRDAPTSTVSGKYDENGICKPTTGLPCSTVLSNCEPTSNGFVRKSQYSESGYACEGIKEPEGCDEGYDKPEGYDECTSIAQLCADEAKGYGPDDAPCKDIEQVDCSEITETNYEDCNKVKCPEGSTTPYADSLDDCIASPAPTCEENDINSESDGQGGCRCKQGYEMDNVEGSPTIGTCQPTKLPPKTCEDPNATNYEQEGECGPCNELYDKPEGYDVCTSIETLCQQDEEYAKDNELCGEVDCTDPANALICGWVECPDGTMAPTLEGCEEEIDCTDPANALVCGWVECDDGTMAPTLGDCDQPTPCSDPEYAAAHPLECGWVECPDGSFAETRDECEEVTCENGATDYPDCTVCPEGSSMDAEGTCVGVTPPPPETGGGGGGGGGGMFNPFLAGISYTPQAVPEPPAPPQKDYMAELDNIIKRSLFEGMA